MKTLLIPMTGLWLLAGVPGALAQIPPPAEVPNIARPTNLPTLGTNSSFFTRNTNFGRIQRTNTALPAAPGAATVPANVPGPTPNLAPPAAANVAGQIPPVRPPGGLPAAPPTTAASSNINIAGIIPKGSTNDIPANMMRFQEADLSQVFELYAELTGKTILKAPQVPQNVKLTLRNQTPLTRQQGIDALSTLLGLNGIAMVPEGEIFLKAVPSAAVPQEATPFTTNEWNRLPDSQVPIAQIVQLKNLSPEEATAMMQPFAKLPTSIVGLKGSPFLIVRDYAENVKRMLEILEKVDVAVPLEIDTVVIPIKYALAGEIASVLSGLGASTSSGFGSSGASSGGLGGGGSGFGGAGGSLGGGLGGAGGRGGATGFGGAGGGLQGGYGNTGASGSGFGAGGNRQLGGTGAGGGGAFGASRTGFGNQLNRAVNRAVGAAGGGAGTGEIQLIGQAKIVPDERSNALLIFADRRDLATISNIIAKLDVVLPQVLIEALILEVNLGDGQSIGVSMKQNVQKVGSVDLAGGSLNGPSFIDPRSISSLGTNALSSGFSYFGRLNQDFDFAINAVANDSRINVLSRPRIVTSTAKPASIFIGETRPYITGTYNNGFGGGGNSSQYSQLQIGINLDVLPIINQEGLVVMDIQQHISQAGKDVQIDGNPVPSTINRDANAYVAVRDRDTIMLGGFISTVKKKSTSGVPYLKDIPGLGILFRSNSEDVQRIELVLLIRPTVLPTPEASALTTASEMDKLPNVKRAEREVDEYNARQQKKELMERERLERLNQK